MRNHVGVLVGLGIGFWLWGCATDASSDDASVRLRFVPEAHAGAPACGGGATWCALGPFPGKAGVLVAQIHAGIGDTFPVQEEGPRTLFQVLVVDGNDDHLVLQIPAGEASRRTNLPRDQAVSVQIGDSKYEFLYPSVHVRASAKSTTGKAMILVTRGP